MAVAFLLLSILPALAQNQKAIYEKAVTQINCLTIQFIHREVGRAEDANNMDCGSFESIKKTIPADESKTTGTVCQDIENFKKKYKEGGSLDGELSLVIKYAYGKINARKRKGNVADFKSKLESTKADALKEAGQDAGSGSSTGSNSSTPNETPVPLKPSAGGDAHVSESDTATGIKDGPGSSSSGKGSNWIGWLSLLIALGALGLSFMNYRKLSGMRGNQGGNSPRTGEDNAATYKKLESKMMEEMARINQNIDSKISARMGYSPAPASVLAKETAAAAPATLLTPEQPGTNVHVLDETADDETFDVPGSEVPQATMFMEAADEAPTSLFPTESPAFNTPLTNEEHSEEDGETVPFYKYVGLPENGYFQDTHFSEAPQSLSVFEIEMYDDVPNKAFFSILPYPEVIKKAISDPERYLAPACAYSDDPTGKRTIVLMEEGMLRKEGDKWHIYEKARIRFE